MPLEFVGHLFSISSIVGTLGTDFFPLERSLVIGDEHDAGAQEDGESDGVDKGVAPHA
jgi:hypothetical protein